MSPEGAFICWRCGRTYFGVPTQFGRYLSVCTRCRPGFTQWYAGLRDEERREIQAERDDAERRLR